MAKQTINIGSAANDGTGSTLRAAFDITNDNFTELYGGTGGLLHKIEGTNFTGSLLIGHSTTGTLSSALNNTGVGINSLKSITSGDANVGLGTRSGFNLTTASGNILIGNRTGENIIDGNYNVAIGDEALFTENGHGKNIAIGYHALRAQDAGTDALNVAIGHQSGKSITTGSNNNLIGGEAGDALTTGSQNIVIGRQALTTEDTGNRNIAIGDRALYDANYNGNGYNVAIGHDAGDDISTGVQNTVIGGNAAKANITTGSNNIVIGYDSDASAADVSNEITLGNSSIANVRIPSDSTLKIGASGDLQLEHLSSNSFIKNTAVGDLYIENQVDDASVIFRSDDGSGGLATYFFLDGQNTRTEFLKDIKFPDNVKANFGTGLDLKIYHNGTHNYIENETGNLIIQQNANDKDILFMADDGSGGVTEYFKLDGGFSSPFTVFPDNSTLAIGSDLDLRISHNGSDTFLLHNGTGNLYIANSTDNKDIIFQSDDGSGGVTTYFMLDGSRADGTYMYTEFPDYSVIGLGNDTDLQLYHNGSNSMIDNFVADLIIQQRADDGDIVFKSDDGGGGVTTYFKLDGANKRTKFEEDILIVDSKKIKIGSGADLQIYHDGHSRIENNTGDFVIQTNLDDGDILFRADDGSGGIAEYFRLDGSIAENTFSRTTKVIDNFFLGAGSSTDLYLTHDGTNSSIINNTGNLTIQNNTDDGDIVFKSDDGSGGTAQYFRLDGGDVRTIVSKPFRFLDSTAAEFGTGLDLQLYHTGGEGTFFNYTGNLRFIQGQDDGDISFISDDGSGGTTEYFKLDGSDERLTVSAPNGMLFSDNIQAKFGTSGDLQILHDGNNSFIQNSTGQLQIIQNTTDEDIIFLADGGSGSAVEYIRLDGSQTSIRMKRQVKWDDNIKATFGDSDDLEIYHNGNNSLIRNNTGNLDIANLTDDGDIIFKCDDGSGGLTEYFRVDGSSEYNIFSKDLYLIDNVQVLVGTGQDLRIYHNGTNNFIEAYSGNLTIQNHTDDADIIFKSDDGSGGLATYLRLDGGDTLMQAGVNLRFSDNVKSTFGNSDDLQISHNGTNSIITNGTGEFRIIQSKSDADLVLQCDDGSGGETAYITLDGSEVSTVVNTIKVLMPNLPTSDPSVAGQLYTDSGVLKVSAG